MAQSRQHAQTTHEHFKNDQIRHLFYAPAFFLYVFREDELRIATHLKLAHARKPTHLFYERKYKKNTTPCIICCLPSPPPLARQIKNKFMLSHASDDVHVHKWIKKKAPHSTLNIILTNRPIDLVRKCKSNGVQIYMVRTSKYVCAANIFFFNVARVR